MKKALFTFAIALFAMVAQAQTAFKVHSDGQISLQSATTSYGIQIPSSGIMSIEPNVFAYGMTSMTQARSLLAKAWCVKIHVNTILPVTNTFYVLGNGSVYAYGSYLTITAPSRQEKGNSPIDGASEMVSRMKGYFMETDEFEGVTPEEIEHSGNITPEVLDGILLDMERSRTAGLVAEELEQILPEAVRHTPEGNMAINYNAIIPVLIEAFKEQQARIEQLESILRENGLLNSNK